MEKAVVYARYVLALAEDAVTEQLRQELANALDEAERSTLAAMLCTVAAKRVAAGEATPEAAQAQAQTEYTGLALGAVLGSWDTWSDFLAAALGEAASEHAGYERAKALAESAASKSADVKAGAYRAALNFVVGAGLVLQDRAFSQQLTEAVAALPEETAGAAAIRMLCETVISL